jgi:hypothetical protein
LLGFEERRGCHTRGRVSTSFKLAPGAEDFDTIVVENSCESTKER